MQARYVNEATGLCSQRYETAIEFVEICKFRRLNYWKSFFNNLRFIRKKVSQDLNQITWVSNLLSTQHPKRKAPRT